MLVLRAISPYGNQSHTENKLLSHGQQHFPIGKIASVTASNGTFPNEITDRVT